MMTDAFTYFTSSNISKCSKYIMGKWIWINLIDWCRHIFDKLLYYICIYLCGLPITIDAGCDKIFYLLLIYILMSGITSSLEGNCLTCTRFLRSFSNFGLLIAITSFDCVNLHNRLFFLFVVWHLLHTYFYSFKPIICFINI